MESDTETPSETYSVEHAKTFVDNPNDSKWEKLKSQYAFTFIDFLYTDFSKLK